MSDKDVILDLLSRPVAYHPRLAQAVGDVKAGVLLSQLLYWHGKGQRKDGWIYKTAEELTYETGLSRKEQATARAKLEKAGVLRTARRGIPATVHFQLRLDSILALVSAGQAQISPTVETGFYQRDKQVSTNGENQIVPTGKTITESTAETTPESTAQTKGADAPPRGISETQAHLVRQLPVRSGKGWESVTFGAVTKLTKKYGSAVVTQALQRASEEGGPPRHSAYGLLEAMCKDITGAEA